jgi:hypothetical protein
MSSTIASPSAAASDAAAGGVASAVTGVFEPKYPFALGLWGKFMCNMHVAFFYPRTHIAYCNMNMGMQYGYFSSK